MKFSSPYKLAVAIWMSCLTTLALAQEPDSLWRLRVTDMHNQVKVEATIRFTNDTARSCMGGSWKRIVVETKTAQAEDFFPLREPLAYNMENGSLTLGRTLVCDGYLLLNGMTGGPVIQGSYDAVGWGSKRLGSFSLQKIL